MAYLTVRERVAERALKLKKAWCIAALLAGYVPRGDEAIIPSYRTWPRKHLDPHINDLEHDLSEAIGRIVTTPELAIQPEALDWLASHFDAWHESGGGVYSMCNVMEFEERLGPLRAHEVLDIPPYAEILLQPGSDVAFRHPEYMLARDLVCLFQLYSDAEALVEGTNWAAPPQWAGRASENAQGLARTTTLTCFNLLESFVSGLARAYSMQHSELDERTRARLLSTRDALRKRILAVPRLIIGSDPGLHIDKPPFSTLFGPIKQYRDSFVHCEPGAEPSTHGYVKQILFHEVSPRLVEDALAATETAIRQVWQAVHGRQGPRWLPQRDSEGRYAEQSLTLSPGSRADD